MRMIAKDVCVMRPHLNYSIYLMVSHKKSVPNPNRVDRLFRSIDRMNYDGLNNVGSLNSSIVSVTYFSLFTHLSINVGVKQKTLVCKYVDYQDRIEQLLSLWNFCTKYFLSFIFYGIKLAKFSLCVTLIMLLKLNCVYKISCFNFKRLYQKSYF